MLRFLYLIPFWEIYFGKKSKSFFENILLKRSMYDNNFKKGFFTFKKTKQPTLNSILEQDEEVLFSKINKKFRNEIRQFSKIINFDKDINFEIEYDINEDYKYFLLKNFRGQKPNISKLKRFSNKKMLLIFSIKYNNEYQTSLIWLKRFRQSRLIYNVLDHQSLKKNKLSSSNKYIMYQSILKMSRDGFKEIDLGGISNNDNNIDRFKKGFSKEKKYTYNYFYF
tara:strand:+ start:5007 stop:5678 length:672 start_codon:yes stop_codon:yes gene_type:complete